MKSKRILSLVLALVMVLGTFGTVFADTAETVVAELEGTGNERVDKLIELDLVKGDGESYRLSDTIRRDEVAAMVVRSMDLESVANAMINVPTKFVDVKVGEWNNGYVAVAEGQNITKGTGPNTFHPERQITYQEVAAMLVRVIGLDPKVEAGFSWPASYVAEAQRMGILNDVEIANMGGFAVREKVFEMVYNALTNKGANLLVAKTVEGIVVENYRTERLASDEITVHVMKDQVEKSGKYYEKGEEFNITINAELKKKGLDVETLLGKVITISFDKDDKVVGIEVNKAYDYLQGSLDEIREKEIRVNGKWHTVEKYEGRVATDERLYQVYLNNEDLHYYESDDFDRNGDVVTNPRSFAGKSAKIGGEYARITVRNGKVLYIDAFAFTDIAPVVENIDKDTVKFYNDDKDGDVDKLTIKDSAYVITFEDNAMKLGNKANIEANDVLHWYTDGRGTATVFVRPFEDNKVEGIYKDVSARSAKDANTVMIKIDDKEYPADIAEAKRDPVYSTVKSETSFYTLTGDYDYELRPFEKEETVLLLDMFGRVQLIGAETVDGTFYGIVTNTERSRGNIKILRRDASDEWYETDRNTRYINTGQATKDKQFDTFGMYDLVRGALKDETLASLSLESMDSTFIKNITSDVVDLDKAGYYYVGKDTAVFVAIKGSTPKAMSVAEFRKNYYVDSTKDTYEDIMGYVVAHDRDEKLANVIVITAANSVKATDDTKTVKVTRVRIRGNEYLLTVNAAHGEELRKDVTSDTLLVTGKEAQAMLTNKEVVAGDVIKIDVTKNEEQNITAIERLLVNADTYKITKLDRDRKRGENYIVLEDATGNVREAAAGVIWVSRNAKTFYTYKVGDIVAIGDIDRYNTIHLLDVRGREVTGIWKSEVEKEVLEAVIADVEKALEDLEDKDLYTEDSVAALIAELTAAKLVLADKNATKEEVQKAVVALIKAKDALELKEEEVVVDKTELEAAIAKAKLDLAGLNQEDYTVESWTAAMDAIGAAEAILADEEATQEEVDAAVVVIVDAMAALELKVVEEIKGTYELESLFGATVMYIMLDETVDLNDVDQVLVNGGSVEFKIVKNEISVNFGELKTDADLETIVVKLVDGTEIKVVKK